MGWRGAMLAWAVALLVMSSGCAGGTEPTAPPAAAAPGPAATASASADQGLAVLATTALPSPLSQPPVSEVLLDARVEARVPTTCGPGLVGGRIRLHLDEDRQRHGGPRRPREQPGGRADPGQPGSGAALCQGLGIGADAVWTCDDPAG